MNQVFAVLVLVSVIVAAATGSMEAVSKGALEASKDAVHLTIELIGYMALFLGLFKIAEDGGLIRLVSRTIKPVTRRLFPEIPANHPAIGAMMMNFSANMLGLTNAATPLGIKAMTELDKLNKTPGTASNAMVLFLAINTSALALLPSGVVSIRTAEGSTDPWGIITPTLVASLGATIVGILAAKTLQRVRLFKSPEPTREIPAEELARGEEIAAEESSKLGPRLLGLYLLAALGILVVPAVWAAALPMEDPWGTQLRTFTDAAGDAVIPVLILSLVGYGWVRKVKVYESFIEGAREGFDTGVRLIPYLVAILVVIGMFRASGAMEWLTESIGSVTDPLGMPGEALPVAIVRPLSGSGSFGIMVEILHTHGPDSYLGYLVSVMNGSTDTTFYVLAVYFGSVGVSRVRHAVAAGLLADLAGIITAVWICFMLFGHLR